MVHTSTQVWEHDASGWHQSGSCSCCLFSLPDERQGGNYRRTSTRNSAECECVGLTIMVSVWVCEMCFKWSGVMGRGGELRYIALCWVELSWVELSWAELSWVEFTCDFRKSLRNVNPAFLSFLSRDKCNDPVHHRNAESASHWPALLPGGDVWVSIHAKWLYNR